MTQAVSAMMTRRHTLMDSEQVVGRLNRVLMGWSSQSSTLPARMCLFFQPGESLIGSSEAPPTYPKWCWVFVMSLLCSIPVPAVLADQFQIGEDAFKTGDYERTFQLWLPLASAGDARAQFGLGALYFDGHGVRADAGESALWFRKAAEQGYAPAQFNLGNAYKHGHGVAQNDVLANVWWRQAAEQEFAPAQFNLATQYYFGRGVEKDETEASYWYRRAAENGHPQALALFETEARLADEAGPTTSSGAHWIRDQSAEHFTIQLLATPSQPSAQDLAARRDLAVRKTGWFKFLREGDPWYAVIHGVFPTRDAARAALVTLPADLRETPPWIRRFGDVKTVVIGME